MSTRVSFITPTYNHGGLLHECIRSALTQTVPEWEMIIVDDGSTDGSPDVESAFPDRRIRYERLPHRGPAALAETYNVALSLATGDLVVPLEGDDIVMPDRLERQMGQFADPAVVLSHGPIDVLLDGGVRVYREHVHPFVSNRRDVLGNEPVGRALQFFRQGNFIWAQSVMIRRAALLEAGGYRQAPGTHLVDQPTYMELALLGRFAFVGGRPLGVWRRHPQSMEVTHGYGQDFQRCIVRDFEARHPGVLEQDV